MMRATTKAADLDLPEKLNHTINTNAHKYCQAGLIRILESSSRVLRTFGRPHLNKASHYLSMRICDRQYWAT